jgi:predicted nuclease of predicted toxin-antitoxin system
VKFKFDENLGRAAATVLLDAGFDVVTVPEQRLERASDHDVIECCVGEERCLVTMDAEFANPLLFPPRRYRGIVLLRLPARVTSELIDETPRSTRSGATRTTDATWPSSASTCVGRSHGSPRRDRRF